MFSTAISDVKVISTFKSLGSCTFDLYTQMIDVEFRTHDSICIAQHISMLAFFILRTAAALLKHQMDGKHIFILANRPEMQIVHEIDTRDLFQFAVNFFNINVIGSSF